LGHLVYGEQKPLKVARYNFAHAGWYPSHNHPCQFWWISVKEFWRHSRILAFSIDLRCGHYNTRTTVQRCECV